MSQALQENLLIIVIILFLIVLILLICLGIILVRFLLSNKKEKTSGPTVEFVQGTAVVEKQVAPERIRPVIVKPEQIKEKFHCENHPEEPSVGPCMICEDVFCDSCLIEHDGLYFCREHFKTFASNKWKQITDIKTTPEKPEDGLFIYNFKRKIWKESQTPSFVVTHYKINIEEDYIESYVQLNVIEEVAEELEKDILNFKARY